MNKQRVEQQSFSHLCSCFEGKAYELSTYYLSPHEDLQSSAVFEIAEKAKCLLQTYQPKGIVADASNYKSYKKLWKATCEKEKIPFHDTSEKGFYKL